MNARVAEEFDEDADGTDDADDADDDGEPEDEVEIPGPDGDDDEPVEPLTHLSDEDYDAFVTDELTPEGTVKGDPPVAAILIGLTLIIVLVWLIVA